MTIKIKLASILFLFIGAPFAQASLDLYKSKMGLIGLSESEGKYTLIAMTGGQPAGGATAGNCVIMAELIKKDNKFTGELVPFKSSYFSYEQNSSERKPIALEIKNDAVVLEDIDTLGVCGLEVSFIDIYYKPIKNSEEYKESYLELLGLAHEISITEYKEENLISAIAIMRPYVDDLPLEWLNNPLPEDELPEFINNYAFFLQSTGHPESAIPLLEKLVNAKPSRTVAWLNLADAYWEVRQFAKARNSYTQYKDNMGAINRVNKIPARVYERLQ